MANLLTCDAVNRGDVGEPVDLFGVGEVHGRTLVVYAELDDDEHDDAMADGLTLEAEGLHSAHGLARLLLADVAAGHVQLLNPKVIWRVHGVPAGLWRLSLRIGGRGAAHRVIGVGEY